MVKEAYCSFEVAKLIEKACDWLRIELVNFEDYIGMGETFIEDFKNYMKGE